VPDQHDIIEFFGFEQILDIRNRHVERGDRLEQMTPFAEACQSRCKYSMALRHWTIGDESPAPSAWAA
jgi:hypothetical protein